MSRNAALVILTVAVLWRPILAAEVGSPATPGIKYSGGDGSTVETAVIITGGGDSASTEAEHAWLHQHVPGARISLQSLLFERGPLLDKVIDKLDVVMPDGSKRAYFFDISSGFGKLE